MVAYPPTVPMPECVLLITPPSVFLLDQRVFVSLGILRVAASLEQKGVAVEHLDLSGIVNPLEVLARHLGRTRASAVGITVTTPQLPVVARMVETIRKVSPGLRIVLGGPHVTLICSALKAEAKHGRAGRARRNFDRLSALADVLVSGDGERAVFPALAPDPPRLVDAEAAGAGLFLTDEAYEEAPLPARHLVDLASYHYEIEGRRSTSIIAQLGCPFGCGFCGGRLSRSFRRIRTRSPASILAEVRALHDTHGFTGFMFYDDELNVSRTLVELMHGLADLQASLGATFRMRGFIKAELFTREQAEAMYGAGFRWILVGFESASARILANIRKGTTPDDNSRAMEIASRAGLKVKALMSVGHPGETPETIGETRDWLLSARPGDFDCTVITTYPGTPYYDEAVPHENRPGVWTYVQKRTGDRLHAVDIDFQEVADYYKGDPEGGYRSFVFTDFLSEEKIVEGRNWVESSVRESLGLAYPKRAEEIRYEHSMGQAGAALPSYLLRVSARLSSPVRGTP